MFSMVSVTVSAGLSVSETDDLLGSPCTTVSRGFTQNCEEKKKKQAKTWTFDLLSEKLKFMVLKLSNTIKNLLIPTRRAFRGIIDKANALTRNVKELEKNSWIGKSVSAQSY